MSGSAESLTRSKVKTFEIQVKVSKSCTLCYALPKSKCHCRLMCVRSFERRQKKSTQTYYATCEALRFRAQMNGKNKKNNFKTYFLRLLVTWRMPWPVAHITQCHTNEWVVGHRVEPLERCVPWHFVVTSHDIDANGRPFDVYFFIGDALSSPASFPRIKRMTEIGNELLKIRCEKYEYWKKWIDIRALQTHGRWDRARPGKQIFHFNKKERKRKSKLK